MLLELDVGGTRKAHNGRGRGVVRLREQLGNGATHLTEPGCNPSKVHSKLSLLACGKPISPPPTHRCLHSSTPAAVALLPHDIVKKTRNSRRQIPWETGSPSQQQQRAFPPRDRTSIPSLLLHSASCSVSEQQNPQGTPCVINILPPPPKSFSPKKTPRRRTPTRDRPTHGKQR